MKIKHLFLILIFSLSLTLALTSVIHAGGPGDLDPTFGEGGKVLTDFGFPNNSAHAVVLQPDGKIVAAGYQATGTSPIFVLTRYNSNGSLDNSFDGDGIVTTPIGSNYGGITAIVLQPDGKIIAAGSSSNGSGTDFALVRYNNNGSRDLSFGSAGILTTSIGSNFISRATAVILQPDDKIIAAGSSGSDSNMDFALVRYHSNGSLDTSFGSNGIVTTPIGNNHDAAQAIALQADGKIVVAGYSLAADENFALVRYNSDGSLDTSFDNDGKVTTPIGSSNDSILDIILQPDNKIVAVGYSNNGTPDFALARYNSDGSLDLSFGAAGKVVTPIDINSNDEGQAVALQADGKIVIAGHIYSPNTQGFALARYHSNGSLDTSFDTDGKVITLISDGYSGANAVTIQADSKIVIAGQAKSTFALARYNSNGSLDNSFDSDGMAITRLSYYFDQALAVALQPNGKIVTAGTSYFNHRDHFALARHNIDGSLDTSFGSSGIVTTSVGLSNVAWAVAVQADGKIVAVGYNTKGPLDLDFTLARYHSNGSLDTSFGSTGIITTALSNSHDYGRAIAIQTDGKIVVAGHSYNGSNGDFTLIRYNNDGSLDTSFDADGKVITPIGSGYDGIYAVALQPDGKIVAAGTSYFNNRDHFTLVRYHIDGSLDTSFGNSGIVTTSIGSSQDRANAVALQSNGRIVVVGDSFKDGGPDLALARYNTDGSLDTSFGSSGIITTAVGSYEDYGRAVAIQADGKIVVAGYTTKDGPYGADFILVRYHSDGSLDTSFDADGKVTTFMGGTFNLAAAITLQSDGKIVVAGGDGQDFALVRYYSGSPALLLTKTVDNVAPIPGQRITYTLTLSNSGSAHATGAVISDTLSSHLSLAGPVRLEPPEAGTVMGTLPVLVTGLTITPEQHITITFPVTVHNGLASGTLITNTAIVTSSEIITPVTGTVAITITDNPAISVTKTANSNIAAVGQILTYTYQVTNIGNITLTNIMASDDRLGNIPLSSASLPPNDSISGQLTYTISISDLPGPLINTVVVAGLPAIGPPVIATATKLVTVQQAIDIQPPTFPNIDPKTGTALITPTLGITVTKPRPLFDWIEAIDNVGVISYTLIVSHSSQPLQMIDWITTTQSFYLPVTDLPDGLYTWTVQAHDQAGNIGSVIPPATFTVQAMREIYLPTILKN